MAMGGAYIATQPGDLIFVRGDDFIDKAIEDITRSTYSHVALVVQGTTLIEAQGGRPVGYQTLDAYRGKADLYRMTGLSNNQRSKIVAAAMKHYGQRYDYPLIALELIRFTMGIVLPWYEGGKVICSTLAKDAYFDGINVDLTPGIKYPAPGDEARSRQLRRVASF